MASGNTSKNVKYIAALNEFINDVKPYHSKFTEIEESVYFSDSMSVKITEDVLRTAIRFNSVYSQNIFGSGAAKTVYGISAQMARGRSEYGVGARVYTASSAAPQAAKDIVGLSASHSSYIAPNSDGILSVSVNQKIQQLGYSVFRSHGVASIDVDANGGNPLWRETLSPESYWISSDARVIQISPSATSQTWSFIKIDPIVTDKILFNGVGLGENSATSVDNQPAINIDPYSLIGGTVQTWTITAISPTVFNVVGSVSGAEGNATVGQQYSGSFKFTIPSSQYVYSAGDTFIFTVLSQQPSYLVFGSVSGMLAPATVGVPYNSTYAPGSQISFTIPAPHYIGPNGNTGTIFLAGNFDLTFTAPPRFDAEEEHFIIRAIDSAVCDVFSSRRGHLPGAVIGQQYTDDYVSFMVTGTPNRNDEVRFSVSTGAQLPRRFGHDVFIFGQAQFSLGTTQITSPITNPGWGSFMNSYAVWNNSFVPVSGVPYIFTAAFTATSAGSKILQIAADNLLKVYVNGVATTAETSAYSSFDTFTVSFNSGTNILAFEVTNSPPAWDVLLNPAGFAAIIRDSISSPILWDTRNNLPTHIIANTGTAGKVTAISTTLHNTASEILIKQYLNDKLYFKTEAPTTATTFTASSIIPISFEGEPTPGNESKTTIKLLNPVNGENVAGTLTLATNVLTLTSNFANTFLPLNKACTIEFEQQGLYVDRVSVKIVDRLVFRLDFPFNKITLDDFMLATRNLGYDTLPYDVATPPFSVIYPQDILQNEGFQIIGITTSTYSPAHALFVAGNQTAAFSSLTNSTIIIADIERSGLYGVTNVIFNGTSTAVIVDRPITDTYGNADVIGKRVYTDRSLAYSRYDRHLEIILPDSNMPLDNTDDISTAQLVEAGIVYDLDYAGTGTSGFDASPFDSSPLDPLDKVTGNILISLPSANNLGDLDGELAQNPLFANKIGSYAAVIPSEADLDFSNVQFMSVRIDYLGETLTNMPKLYMLKNFLDTAPVELSLVNRFASSTWRSFTAQIPPGSDAPINDPINNYSCFLILVV